VKDAAATIAAGMMSYYVGNQYGQTPGILPGPYYWWEAGAMWGAMINYWHYTNDTTYNDLTMQGLQWQVGPHNDYMPPNASASLGNDDQAFWGMAAMAAAEYKFPNPLQSQPSWLSLAQAVFNEQMGRWDTQFCNGGIRWQIYQITGYDLKNTISNGCFFNLASRLARYTSDDLYAQWAEKAWNWLWDIGLIDSNYNVYDNTEANRLNCTTIDHTQWSYNAGTLLMGASTMWNYVRRTPSIPLPLPNPFPSNTKSN
jgi:mannan endo-1,6-alpha-mannosidase